MSFPVLHLIVFLPLGAAIVVAPELDADRRAEHWRRSRTSTRGGERSLLTPPIWSCDLAQCDCPTEVLVSSRF